MIWEFILLHFVLQASANVEGDALTTLKSNLVDPKNVLQTWDANSANPCMWSYITCNDDESVTRVELGNAYLSGQLVPQLGQLSNLLYLELFGNHISGKIPEELGNLTNLVTLNLYQNNLSGTIPDTLGKLGKLRYLRLSNNSLTGSIPMSLTCVASLQVIDLSNNQLEGDIPVNGSFSAFNPISFQNNPRLKHPKTTPPSQASSGNSNTWAIVGGVAAGAALLFAALAIALACWGRRKPQDHFFDVPAEEDPKVHLGPLKKFSEHELRIATDNFSDKHILGSGGFGKVYKGRLIDSTLVAVKRIKEERTPRGELQFQTEVKMISMAVHRNLLRLRGFCTTPTERLLVYPFMVNGSVESCLRGERRDSQPPLEWPIRKRIALGSARGLAYLHDHCDSKIIHRDFKSSNILLDEEFEAIVGDFGLAKHMAHEATHATTFVCGTMGYWAPEYLLTGKASEKGDVFGYGTVLLDLITGQTIIDRGKRADDVEGLGWVKRLLKDKKFDQLVDPNLQGIYDAEEVEQLTQLALLCKQRNPVGRPKMSEVVRMLECGDGLAGKWEKYQDQEMSLRQDYNNLLSHLPNARQVGSTSEIQPAEL